jgi:hypothetical protein
MVLRGRDRWTPHMSHIKTKNMNEQTDVLKNVFAIILCQNCLLFTKMFAPLEVWLLIKFE